MKITKALKKLTVFTAVLVCMTLSACLIVSGPPNMADRKYERPDGKKAFVLIDEIYSLLNGEDNTEEIEAKREELFSSYYYKAMTLATLAEINYYMDVTDPKTSEENGFMTDYVNRLQNETLKLDQAILTSPSYGEHFKELLGEKYVNSVLSRHADTEAELKTLSEIKELQNRYGSLYNAGKYDEIADVYTKLITKSNGYARNKKNAEGKPYKNYPEYAYAEIFGRDYTPCDAKVFAENAVQYILPVAKTIYDNLDGDDFASPRVSMRALKGLMPEIIRESVPEMKSSWDYMRKKGLYDFSSSEKKLDISFITEFYEYGDAFMFIKPSGYLSRDLSTLIHEFGHYNEVFMSDESLQEGDMNYDLAETHSQCYELLTLAPLEHILTQKYGRRAFKSYVSELMFDAVWSILSNCVFDEFEQICYSADPAKLNDDFYQKTMTDLWKKYWVYESALKYYDVTHLFNAPSYCISYSVSMTFSAEIWAGENPVENYVTVVKYGDENRLGKVCEAIKLPSPLLPESVEAAGNKLSVTVKKYL